LQNPDLKLQGIKIGEQSAKLSSRVDVTFAIAHTIDFIDQLLERLSLDKAVDWKTNSIERRIAVIDHCNQLATWLEYASNLGY